MTTAARFTFDLDLGHTHEKRRIVSETALAAMLDKTRAEGRAEGLAEGEKTVSARAAQTLAAAAQTLASRGAEMLAAVDAARAENLRDAVELAASIGRKLASNLMARQPVAEIETLITECLATLDAAPHLVIRCAPELADAVKEIASARMATSSFSGRLVVMGDPEQHLGDCRLEWVDGGLVRNLDAITSQIDNRIAAYLAASAPSAKENTP
ncbi:MAG TPA: flagellar assembly protein FliH [Devosiaceae bacterium]|jgi:flagellar assembly protein FliH